MIIGSILPVCYLKSNCTENTCDLWHLSTFTLCFCRDHNSLFVNDLSQFIVAECCKSEYEVKC